MALPQNDPSKAIFSRKTPAPNLDAEGHTYSNWVLRLVRARLSFARVAILEKCFLWFSCLALP